MPTIPIEPLTRDAFAPFGDVVDMHDAMPIQINQGFAERCNGLARIDVSAESGAVNISLFSAQPLPSPLVLQLMERHPLGSQLFYPLQDRLWLVVVCDDPLHISSFRAFAASGRQGVNYARNIWHHPLVVHDADSRFIVVDRAGAGTNLEEFVLPEDRRPTLSVMTP